MSLSGRLAIVTGGGSGIGKAVCHALAGDGATVVVADINRALHVDVGDSSSVAALMSSVSSRCRTPMSIVVNCAGIDKQCAVVDMTEDDYDELLCSSLSCPCDPSHLRAVPRTNWSVRFLRAQFLRPKSVAQK